MCSKDKSGERLFGFAVYLVLALLRWQQCVKRTERPCREHRIGFDVGMRLLVFLC